MFGEYDERWWDDERVDLLMQLRHEHRQPWPVVTKLIGHSSELAVMRKYYYLIEQSHERLDKQRIHADNLARVLRERQSMLKPSERLAVADPGFKLMKKIVGMVRI